MYSVLRARKGVYTLTGDQTHQERGRDAAHSLDVAGFDVEVAVGLEDVREHFAPDAVLLEEALVVVGALDVQVDRLVVRGAVLLNQLVVHVVLRLEGVELDYLREELPPLLLADALRPERRVDLRNVQVLRGDLAVDDLRDALIVQELVDN